jgi:hypothetical protein
MQPITKAEFDAVVPLASLELKSCRTYRMSPAGDMQHVSWSRCETKKATHSADCVI